MQPQEPGHPPPAFYLDGHKKPVYTDHLIPRGLIGRTGKILSCRALLLLHDAQGHPLFATTRRGDLHLTKATSTFLERYEQATGATTLARLIIDREGMAAEFLTALVTQGRTVVTIHPALHPVSGNRVVYPGGHLHAVVLGLPRRGDA